MKKTINKTLFILAAATSISLASFTVYAADSASTKTETKTERDADGNYVNKTTEENKDYNGTSTSDTSEVKVKVDSDGSYKKTTESKSSKDPKGLMNKSVAKTSETIKNEDGKYEDKSSAETKNGITGTKTTKEGDVEVKTDSNGNTEKTVETKSTTDPKGLMNKETVKTTDKVENKNGKSKYRHTKKVNGDTIEDKTLESK